MYGYRAREDTISTKIAQERGSEQIARAFAQNIVRGGRPAKQAKEKKDDSTWKEINATPSRANKYVI